jgi:hypothetical protein
VFYLVDRYWMVVYAMCAEQPRTLARWRFVPFLALLQRAFLIGDSDMELAAGKEFSTGSFGWYLNGKVLAPIDGKNVSVQIGMNLTVVGSKDAEK